MEDEFEHFSKLWLLDRLIMTIVRSCRKLTDSEMFFILEWNTSYLTGDDIEIYKHACILGSALREKGEIKSEIIMHGMVGIDTMMHSLPSIHCTIEIKRHKITGGDT